MLPSPLSNDTEKDYFRAFPEKAAKPEAMKLLLSRIGSESIYSDLEEIADIATRYPNMNYLLAHSGWTWEMPPS